MDIMFMGTPDIAVPCLDALAKHHRVLCVVTQTDKPKGRGRNVAMPPVKVRALELGIDVYQPTTLKQEVFEQTLQHYQPDVIAVVAYGKILPQYVLDAPKHGCINVHTSLLPKYRGAAPIQWAIVNNEAVTGVTSMKMDTGLDTGDILLKQEIPISPTMTAGQLHDEMCTVCPDLLLKTLDGLGTIVPQPQDDANASYAPLLTRENTRIDWSLPAEKVFHLVRGMNPVPAAHTTWKDKALKVFEVELCEGSGSAGQVIALDSGIVVACGTDAVRITQLQPQGKKSMPASAFLNGHSIQIGETLV